MTANALDADVPCAWVLGDLVDGRLSEFLCDGHLETNGRIPWRDEKPRLFPTGCLTSFWLAPIPRQLLRKMVFSTS